MHVITAMNVDSGLVQGLNHLAEVGRRRGSRNGEVVVAPGPVTTHYPSPRNRVSTWSRRDANPFFHLYESLWMLGGRNDVKSVASYVKRMESYSDDGERLHGAYGFRWRQHFGFDQLRTIIARLRTDPEDRRCVLTMWDPKADLGIPSRDLPCNTQVYFTRDWTGRLDMTVTCRSNDIIWGCYGANAVHFSVLLEYVAGQIGCPIGQYWQVSNNYHAYTPLYDDLLLAAQGEDDWAFPHEYLSEPFPLMSVEPYRWDLELECFLSGVTCEGGHREHFFSHVAQPFHDAYRFYKDGKIEQAIARAADCVAQDWRRAGVEWLLRRKVRRGVRVSGTPSQEA